MGPSLPWADDLLRHSLAKDVSELDFADATGRIVVRKRLLRGRLFAVWNSARSEAMRSGETANRACARAPLNTPSRSILLLNQTVFFC